MPQGVIFVNLLCRHNSDSFRRARPLATLKGLQPLKRSMKVGYVPVSTPCTLLADTSFQNDAGPTPENQSHTNVPPASSDFAAQDAGRAAPVVVRLSTAPFRSPSC